MRNRLMLVQFAITLISVCLIKTCPSCQKAPNEIVLGPGTAILPILSTTIDTPTVPSNQNFTYYVKFKTADGKVPQGKIVDVHGKLTTDTAGNAVVGTEW